MMTLPESILAALKDSALDKDVIGLELSENEVWIILSEEARLEKIIRIVHSLPTVEAQCCPVIILYVYENGRIAHSYVSKVFYV